LGVTLRDGAGRVFLTASLTPVPFTDIWSRLTSGDGDRSASAAYQSTLTDLHWGDVSASPLLTQLRAAAGDGMLSIKFNVDGYAGPLAGGRIAGTVGVAAADEPVHTVLPSRQSTTARRAGTRGRPGSSTCPPTARSPTTSSRRWPTTRC
jgi:hypothetical protein